MCGIAGVASTSDARVADGSASSLVHRGPDGSGHAAAEGAGWRWELLHTRLSIVDLTSAGNQPMASGDDRYVLSYNGEIYNAPSLRAELEGRGHRFRSHMDGEVILHLWEEIGEAALERLNGIFAVAVADRVDGTIVLARDPLGVKPLFTVVEGDTVWFASELTALDAIGASLGGPDVVGLAQFLTFLWIPDPHTPYERARAVPPGHLLRWRRGIATVSRYGEPLVPTPVDGRPDAVLIEEAEEHIRAATRRQLLADVPIGIMASGGVDSSLLWTAAGAAIGHAFTIKWEGTADESLEEDTHAVRRLRSLLGTDVVEMRGEGAPPPAPSRSGDLFADPAYQLTSHIAAGARARGYKVLLSGQGGDELFGGYRRHRVAGLLARRGLRPVGAAVDRVLAGRQGSVRLEYAARLARATAATSPLDGYLQLCTYSTAVDRARILGCTEGEVADEVVWARHSEVFESLPTDLSFFRRAITLDLLVYLPGLGLAYADRAAMEHSVEVRVPLLDLELVRWALGLPDSALLRRGRGKWIARQAAERWFGAALAHRPKRPFGAPAGAVSDAPGFDVGSRGFRQDRYLARASTVLDAHLASTAVR